LVITWELVIPCWILDFKKKVKSALKFKVPKAKTQIELFYLLSLVIGYSLLDIGYSFGCWMFRVEC